MVVCVVVSLVSSTFCIHADILLTYFHIPLDLVSAEWCYYEMQLAIFLFV